jgi:hypothetical protein
MGWPKGVKRGPRARKTAERESSDQQGPVRAPTKHRAPRSKRTSFEAFTTVITALVVGSDAVEEGQQAPETTVAQEVPPVAPTKRKRIQARP